MIIFYKLGNNLYVNITNRCPCDCVFCIRKSARGMNENESLWLDREPTFDEIITSFHAAAGAPLDSAPAVLHTTFGEIVFCGYGEPMERADDVIALARYFKDFYKQSPNPPKIRLNTNGLARLINPAFDISSVKIFDTISVSLNAPTEEAYLQNTRPKFGAAAFSEMLEFIKDAKKYTNVCASIVGENPHNEDCRKLARNLGVPLRIR